MVCLTIQSSAQLEEYTFKEKNVYTTWGYNAFIGNTGLLKTHKIGFDQLGNEVDYVEDDVLQLYPYVGGLFLDTRVNLVNHSDWFSLSLNVPLSLSAININGENLTGNNILGVNANTTVLIDFNFFYRSTYNNINNRGFHAGIGIAANANFAIEKVFEERMYASPTARIGYRWFSSYWQDEESSASGFEIFVQGTLPKKVSVSNEDKLAKGMIRAGLGFIL